MPTAIYKQEAEPIVISKPLMDLLLKQDKFADLFALYCFYYYTAKWQKTNRPRVVASYVQNGLNWTKPRFYSAKNKLKELGLIKDYKALDKTTNAIIGHYIQINFIWSKAKANKAEEVVQNDMETKNNEKPEGRKPTPLENLPNSKTQPVANFTTNALNADSLNALSVNSLNALNSDIKTPDFSSKNFNTQYIGIFTEKLREVLQDIGNRNIPDRKIKRWPAELSLFMEETKIEPSRVLNAIEALSICNELDEFRPSIDNMKDFTDKFSGIERSMKRVSRLRDVEDIRIMPT